MPQLQQIHTGGPQYASPLIRASSPSSSVASADILDETSRSDTELSPYDFAMKYDAKIGLLKPRPEEIAANKEPLLLPRPKTAAEEKQLYEQVVTNLREQVRKVEHDDLFEQTVLRTSLVGLEQQPSSNDIDAIMRSLMSPATSIGSSALIQNQGVASSMWAPDSTRSQDTAQAPPTDSSATTTGRRITRSKGKAKAR